MFIGLVFTIETSSVLNADLKIQDQGSELTYHSRYNLGCLLSIRTDYDDDAESIKSKEMRKNKTRTQIMLTCQSVLGNKVVLTKNVYNHLVRRHPELVLFNNLIELIKICIESPNIIAKGKTGESIALLRLDDTHRFLAVFYIESSRVKTAFITSKLQSFTRRGIIWRK